MYEQTMAICDHMVVLSRMGATVARARYKAPTTSRANTRNINGMVWSAGLLNFNYKNAQMMRARNVETRLQT